MNGEIQLISDGDGLAVIGNPTDVDLFLTSSGLASTELMPLSIAPSAMSTGGAVLQVASEFAENYGRWAKLTKKSADDVRRIGLRQSSRTQLATGVVKGQKGRIKGFVEFVQAPGTVAANLLNPANLAMVGAMMQQRSMENAMEEIKEYLVLIEAKVDDVLRAQEDSALAAVLGAELVIDEAVAIRQAVGRVSEVTWSKIQGTASIIASTQVYALRQLDALVDKVEGKTDFGEISKAVNSAQPKVQEWLAVLARSVQLQDALAVIELDRVLDASPEEMELHRLGIRAARKKRLTAIAHSTAQLVARFDAAANKANAEVLTHPRSSPKVVNACNHAAIAIVQFEETLGIDSGRASLIARRWTEAVVDAKDRVVEVSTTGLSAGKETVGRAVDMFRTVDLDGDGVPDKPQALTAVQNVGSAITGTAAGTAQAIGSKAGEAGLAVKGAAAGAVSKVGSLLRRNRDDDAVPEDQVEPAT